MSSCWVLALLCVMGLAMGQVSLAQNSPRDFLRAHNAARARVGVGPMAWDNNVAAYARNYANQRRGDCRLVHSGGPYGENIFWGSGREFTAADAVNAWESEKQFYNRDSNTCADGKVCGHYTQVVWRNSVRLGCARVKCNNGAIFTFSRGLPDSGVGSNVHLSGMGNSAHSMNGFPPAQSQGNFDPEAGIDTNLKKFSNNSPCPTLFVANLGLNCTEQGLNQIFSSCPGFLKLKMQNKRGVPVAFVDFQDVASSTVALRFLQGSPQFSLDGEGMRLEYAKSRMGMRKRERRS